MTDDEIFKLWTALQPHIRRYKHSLPPRFTSYWMTTVLKRDVFRQEAHEASERLNQIYDTQRRLQESNGSGSGAHV